MLKSTYHDTHNADLRRRRLTLCVHRVGQGWQQTLEERGAPAGALRPRVESEHPVARGRLDLNRIEDARLRSKLVRWHAAGELGPRFETVIRRTPWQLETPDGASVECALDQGRLRTVDVRRSIPWCEVELVLKSGPPRALIALARERARSLPLSLEVRSHAERGYMVWRGESPTKPCKADALVLSPDATAANAMARIVESGSANLQGTIGRISAVSSTYAALSDPPAAAAGRAATAERSLPFKRDERGRTASAATRTAG